MQCFVTLFIYNNFQLLYFSKSAKFGSFLMIGGIIWHGVPAVSVVTFSASFSSALYNSIVAFRIAALFFLDFRSVVLAIFEDGAFWLPSTLGWLWLGC